MQPFGQVAQLVEQRTENPRVGGSIPSLATTFSRIQTVTYTMSPESVLRFDRLYVGKTVAPLSDVKLGTKSRL